MIRVRTDERDVAGAAEENRVASGVRRRRRVRVAEIDGRPLWSGRARCSGSTRRACRSLRTSWTRCASCSCRTLRSGGTGCALLREQCPLGRIQVRLVVRVRTDQRDVARSVEENRVAGGIGRSSRIRSTEIDRWSLGACCSGRTGRARWPRRSLWTSGPGSAGRSSSAGSARWPSRSLRALRTSRSRNALRSRGTSRARCTLLRQQRPRCR